MFQQGKPEVSKMVSTINGETLLSLINNLPVFIYRGYRDWTISVAAKAVEAITGYSPSDFTSGKLTWKTLIHPEDQKWLKERYRNAVKNRVSTLTTRYRIIHKNGDVKWVEDRRLFSYDPNGKFLFVDGALIDVTEVVEAEQALKESEERFRKIAQCAHDAIFTIDISGKIVFWNYGAEKIFGYREEEILGENFLILVPEEKRNLHKILLNKVAEGEKIGLFGKVVDVVGVRKSGERFPLEISIAQWEENGNVYITPIVRDVSVRKKLEEELKREKEELERAKAELQKKHEELQTLFKLVEKAKKEWERTMDCVDDMIFLTDEDDSIIRCNRAALNYIGKDFGEVIGKNLEELLDTHIPATGVTYGETKELHHEETDKWFILRVYPYKDSHDPSIRGKVVTLQDTTELKKAHQELEKAYEELKRTQAQILQQDKMASIGQLAAGVAHEINNPMGFISSNLSTLRKYADRIEEFTSELVEAISSAGNEELTKKIEELKKKKKIDFILDDLRDLIEESLEGAARVRKIVQDLKSFSRVDEAEMKHADINECLESTINIVWNEIKYKAKLVRDYGELPQTKCYPQQLNQVFMNILVNAAHAIEKDGVITVKTWHEDGNIYVQISDTGCGIPENIINRIFEPFFTTKEVGKGTGLGLSISYDIIKKHNGDISVKSKVGEGTTFTIRIPVVDGR